jgi:hypothetical protein
VAELVDARDLKSLDGNVVWVRVPPPAPCSNEPSGVYGRQNILQPAPFKLNIPGVYLGLNEPPILYTFCSIALGNYAQALREPEEASMSEFNEDTTFAYEISDEALEASAGTTTMVGSVTGAGCDGCRPLPKPTPSGN